jgi:predicted phosphodiesterase
MLLQYISDIHLECHDKQDKGNLSPEIFLKPAAPYLALCGDIGIPDLKAYSVFLEWCSQNWQQVFLVAGNHEYYNFRVKPSKSMKEKKEKIKEICDKLPNVHFLDCASFWLEEEKVRILGCTMWTNIHDSVLDLAAIQMNDTRQIVLTHGRQAFPEDLREIHLKEKAWLEAEIAKCQAANEKCIVLTHHLPSFQLINEKYEGHYLNSCFASNLHALIQKPVCAWLCGHSHTGKDMYINQVYCSLNPFGYPGEGVETKNREKVFEIRNELSLSEILDSHHR